ncbi:MAG: PqqD family protein [Pseudomonadota bacterium]
MTVLVKRNPRVLSSALPDGHTALLVIETGRYVTFDATATAIWNLTEQPITKDGIVSSLLAEFDVTPERLEEDVAHALAALEDKRIVTLTEEA